MNRNRAILGVLAVVLTAGLLGGCDIQRVVPEPKTETAVVSQEAALPPLEQGIPEEIIQHEIVVKEVFREQISSLEQMPLYTIQASIDPLESRLSGKMALRYNNQEDRALESLFFRLFPNGGKSYGDGSLRVTQIRVDNQVVATRLSLENSVLEADLPEPVLPGEQLEISCSFEGEITRDFGGAGYGLYNQTDSVISLSGWFPLLAVFDDEGWNLDSVSSIGDSVYSDAAFFDVRVTAPEDFVLVATGENVEKFPASDGFNTVRFLSGPARDFYLILSPDFQLVQENAGETEVNAYYLPGDKPGAELAAEVAADSILIFNERFGLYPYQELDVVQAPMQYAAGIEFPGVILVGSQYYDQYQDLFFSIVVAHEVAHQWWYNVVGSDVIDEPWLDEALVTYSSNLYFQEEFGEEIYQELIAYNRLIAQQTESQGSTLKITDGLDDFEATAEGRAAYSPLVYSKGSLFYAELRERIGDQAFFSALQRYYQENTFGIGTPPELLGSFESAAGTELDDFYQSWLYQ